mgnify:FL=1
MYIYAYTAHSHAIGRALDTSWDRGVGRISLARLCLGPPAVGLPRLSCVWPAGGSPAPPSKHKKYTAQGGTGWGYYQGSAMAIMKCTVRE